MLSNGLIGVFFNDSTKIILQSKDGYHSIILSIVNMMIEEGLHMLKEERMTSKMLLQNTPSLIILKSYKRK